jgi:hypothetical protein
MAYPVLISVVIACPVVLIAWVAAEFHARPAVRVFLGVVCLCTACVGAFFLGGFGPGEDLMQYQMSVGRLKTLIERGETSRVQKVFREADSQPNSKDSYGGRLWGALSKDFATDHGR